MRSLLAILRLPLSAALLSLAVSGHAAPSSARVAPADVRGFDQFKHTRWTIDDGAPTGNWSMAQTPDGWLWFAARNGLFRFDGVSFEHIPAPAHSLTQGPDGSIWAIAHTRLKGRLFRWTRGRWDDVSEKLAVPKGLLANPCVAGNGTMWIMLQEDDAGRRLSAVYLKPGGKHFQQSDIHVVGTDCFSDRQGNLWNASSDHVKMIVDSLGRKPALSPNLALSHFVMPANAGVFDNRGGLWGADGSVGIYYLPDWAHTGAAPPHVYRFSSADGLD